MRTTHEFLPARVFWALLLIPSLIAFGAGCAGVTQSTGGGGNTPPPPTLSISSVASSGITSSGATITWITSAGASSQVEYGTTASYGQTTAVNSSMVTSHSVALSGLNASTQYHYRVNSTDASGNSASSPDFTFTTSASTSTPPTISAVASGSITSSGATITWTTNVVANSQVEYGTTTAYGQSTTLNATLVTSHSVALSSLTASTTYHFRVKSADGSGNLATSGDFTFTTTAASTPPTISAVASGSITSSGATITWTTNVAANSQVEYGTTTAYGQSTTLNASLVTAHSVALTGLTASTTYHFRVKSANSSGNATSGDFTFTTTAASAPPVISAVASGSITSSGATITWTTDVAANSQVEYGTTTAYGQSTTLNASLVTSHSVALASLTASTTYHFRVKSANSSGNATSGDFTFATTASTTPPTISSVTAGSITSSGVTVTWTTNVAANSQVEYGTTTAYGQTTAVNTSLVTSHSVALSGLTASTLYHYRVKSADGSGNLATSGDFTFTTTPASTGSLTVSITAPANSATVGGTVTAAASTSGSAVIIGVQYMLDGAKIGPVFRSSPYSFFWDTSVHANGAHTLTAVARDSAGNTATSAPVSVTIQNTSSTVVNVTPSNWCGTINSASPGQTIVLAAGSYTDSCHITSSGTAAAPITIRSQSSTSRASLVYAGASANVVDLGGSYIAMRWLNLGPSQDGIDGIRIRATHDNVIEENTFNGIGGVAVPNNDGGTTPRITVRNNSFLNTQSTVIYMGCHDGAVCHSPDTLIEGNFISGAQPGDGVGSGVQIKLNSYATVRDNTIYNTTGAGIIIYGSNEGDPVSVVEGNYVQGAQDDAGINVSGGATIVRNNVLVQNGFNGIWAQDYNGRNLQSNVWIINNTILNNQGGGISVQNWQSGRGNVMAFNAINPQSGSTAYDPSANGTITGNIVCSPASSCFDQASSAPYDLWPLTGGPLIGAAGSGSEPWRVFDDFMGVLRTGSADTGAFQRTGSGSGPAVGGGNARPPRQ